MPSENGTILNILKRKIFLLIGRAVLTAVKNDSKMMKVQLTGLKDEGMSDVERPEPYGLATYPEAGEAVVLFPNGNRDQGLAIIIHESASRPTDLVAGDVRLWNNAGSKVDLKADGQIVIDNGTGSITINADGTIEISGGGTLEKSILGETLDAWLSTHTHAGGGGGPVLAPNEPTTGILSEEVKNT